MSNQMTLSDYIDSSKDKFLATTDSLDWEKEAFFAYDQLTKNAYTMKVARENPNSVKMAMVNVASVGLSLNTKTEYAYLVPRGGAICLDLSYKGLIKIATDTGAIMWAKAELVYDKDDFQYKGPTEKPEHLISDPFDSRRGSEAGMMGVYCIAKTHDGDFLTEIMSIDELKKIRDEASAAGNKGPWSSYFGEMAKKCVIKRASKTWPKSGDRLTYAVKHLHDIEGSDFEKQHRFKPKEKEQIISDMRDAMARGDDLAVRQIVEEYDADPTKSAENEIISAKFWSLFNAQERNIIHRLLNDNIIAQDRLTMGKPEFNEPIEEPGL